jgi:hypothetical protein
MAHQTTYSAIFGDVQRLHTSMEATVRPIPHLEAGCLRRGDARGRAQDLLQQQLSLTASKQELSQRVALLRQGVPQHLGKPSEKLAEFGLQPLRG